MEFQPINRGAVPSDAEGKAPVVTYRPTRTSPSMGSSSSPIPGAGQGVQLRGVPQEPGQAPGEAGGEGGEEEGAPEEIAARADLSRRLGILAQKDKRIRERQQLAAEAETRTKAREEQLAAREAQIQKWEAEDAERRKSPRKALRDYGFTPEAALQYELSGGKLTAEQEAALRLDETLAAERERTQAELQAIRDEQARILEERQQQDEEAEQATANEQEQLAVQEMQADIGAIIEADEKAFPLLAMSKGGVSAVYSRIEEISDEEFQKTGRRPPITTKLLERAAKWVEDAARKELEETNAKLGYRPAPLPPRAPRTLSNAPLQRRAAAEPTPEEESPSEKRARVTAHLDQLFGRAPRRQP